MKRTLVLENGAHFTGTAIGASPTEAGEVVFNTGMTGYQEIFTDPSYCGQIVTMTYPMIGNYGINRRDFEQTVSRLHGVIVRSASKRPNHYRSRISLDEWLKEQEIPGLEGVDTRRLTKMIRTGGTMKGCFIDGDIDENTALVFQTKNQAVQKVSQAAETWHPGTKDCRIVLLDFGSKNGIIRELTERGCEVISVPWNTSYQRISALMPDGIMLSNGPGNPEEIEQTVPVIRKLAETYPLFGICLGHQLLAMAYGAGIEKMTFGHRGSNQPVQNVETGKMTLTSQNHSYTIREDTFPGADLHITHRNLNDHSIEGIRHRTLPVFSVQYHPEAAPGPHDSRGLFDQFLKMIHTGGMAHA
ncbi:carbamoyl phosphate synthase small subunit [Alkalicoccus urumqiensis]|uniref:Carbamoyl phosphate synthase small chain n=1 Tax=Alkalicoccus urumqiensis TaxID=1548213 RepID=A0A2P6MG82_ALKUR|nr:carbamoyl phosphate synthase small subunit [Alkalicoccus urumqiensis]PRO65298.1 carbamoyl phosphate synthase small subunit [Alkalicoccus urumqiensis]